jgi:hypothetical protein
VKYGSTIIKRQSSETEWEGTLDSGQLRCGADRPSGPNAVWIKQFRPPRNQLKSQPEILQNKEKNMGTTTVTQAGLRTGAGLLVESLEAQGVKHIFGIPGAKIDKVFDSW